MIDHEQYAKVRDYLVAQGQQELAGHVDGMWQTIQAMPKSDAIPLPAPKPPTPQLARKSKG